MFNDLAGATRDSSFKPFIYFIIIPYKKHFSVFFRIDEMLMPFPSKERPSCVTQTFSAVVSFIIQDERYIVCNRVALCAFHTANEIRFTVKTKSHPLFPNVLFHMIFSSFSPSREKNHMLTSYPCTRITNVQKGRERTFRCSRN